jgi:hypothetical protein
VIKSCSIIVNGNFNSSNLENCNSLVGCNFKLIEESITFDYYFLMDPIFFLEDSKISDQHKIKRDLLFNILINLDYSLILVVPIQFKNKIKCNFPKLKVEGIIFRSIPSLGKYFDLLLVNLGFSLSSMNVIFAMITFLIKKGFRLIFIYGADHNWISSIKTDIDNNIIYTPTGNVVFVPVILTDFKFRKLTMAQFIKTQYNNFTTHDRIEKLSNLIGVTIINKSIGSYITSYKKKF